MLFRSMEKFADLVSEYGNAEKRAAFEGRSLTMIINPLPAPKSVSKKSDKKDTEEEVEVIEVVEVIEDDNEDAPVVEDDATEADEE